MALLFTLTSNQDKKMKKATFFLLVLILGVLLSNPVWAQIYKYQDTSGQIFFTNDITQVPEEYRDQLTNYYEARPNDTNAAYNNMAEETVTETDNQPAMENPQLEMRRQALENTRSDLDRTFEDLNRRQQALEERRLTIPVDDQDALTRFNAEVTELNLSIENYKQRTTQYENDVRSFNQLLMDLNP